MSNKSDNFIKAPDTHMYSHAYIHNSGHSKTTTVTYANLRNRFMHINRLMKKRVAFQNDGASARRFNRHYNPSSHLDRLVIKSATLNEDRRPSPRISFSTSLAASFPLHHLLLFWALNTKSNTKDLLSTTNQWATVVVQHYQAKRSSVSKCRTNTRP